MPVQYPNLYTVDLAKGPAVKQLNKPMFYGDISANRIGAYVQNNGTDVSLSGTCSGTAMLANGGTAAITGTVSGNLAYVDLPAGVYSCPGPIRITIKYTESGITTTLVEVVGTVIRTETGTVIDPGTIIPSVTALIADIDAAVASIPQDYSTLSGNVTTLMTDVSDLQTADVGIKSALAKNYAYMTFPIAKGEYCLYQGALFKAKQDIPTSESWTAAHWEMAVLGEDLAVVGKQITDIAPIFSASAVYEAGDLVWYNGRLYRADQSHTGAWNAYHFTAACLNDGIKATIGGNNAICLRGAEKIGNNRFVGERVGDALADHIGETISVSFDLKASVARRIKVYAYQSIGYSIEDTAYFTPSTAEYTRFSFVTKAKNYGEESGYDHNGMVGFYDETDANTIYVKNFKIELGSIATPWAMSAQDAFEQAIQSLDIATVTETKAYLGIE